MGTRETPDLPVAVAARPSIAIPMFVQPVRVGAHSYADGGIVDVFPVRPVLDDRPDVIVGVNCYLLPDFAGEDLSGWREQSFAVLRQAISCVSPACSLSPASKRALPEIVFVCSIPCLTKKSAARGSTTPSWIVRGGQTSCRKDCGRHDELLVVSGGAAAGERGSGRESPDPRSPRSCRYIPCSVTGGCEVRR
jgi:predicted acylesterase/phospholipase RssA